MALPGFPDIEYDIKEADMPAVEIVAAGLNKLIGKENALSNAQVRKFIKKKYDLKISDPKYRAIITYIRGHNLVPRLCSCGKGSYKAETDEEWEEWKESMRCRIKKMQSILDIAEYFNDGKETL
jgi:hypothetical protein